MFTKYAATVRALAVTGGLWACGGASAQFAVNVGYDAPDFDLTDGVPDADPVLPGVQASLRSVLMHIGTLAAGGYTVTIPAGVFALTVAGGGEDLSALGDLDITRDVSIRGAGMSSTIIDARALGDRVFHLPMPGGRLSLADLTVLGGGVIGEGGGVLAAAGPIVGRAVRFEGCSASGSASSHGGAVSGALAMEFERCEFMGNVASGQGGAVFAGGAASLILRECVLLDNLATRHGGAVYSGGRAVCARTRFELNRSNLLTGAFHHTGSLSGGGNLAELESCIFVQNVSAGGGGAVFNSAILTETLGDYRLNSAAGGGGAIENRGSMVLRDTYLESNTSGSSGGAITNNALATLRGSNVCMWANTAAVNGGAISNAGSLDLSRCTIRSNQANGTTATLGGGGGLYNITGDALIVNSTFSGNIAPNGHGGAVLNQVGTVRLWFCTLWGNGAFLIAPDAGNSIYNGGSGPATLELTHTVLYSPAPSPGVAGPVPLTSLGYNFDSDGTGGLGSIGDQSPVPGAFLDPMLALLTHETPCGGHVPMLTSPLIGGGTGWILTDPSGRVIDHDQRSMLRMVGAYDIGAIEVQGCAADFDGDGFVDFFDFDAFVQAFINGDPQADFNNDGFIDFFDFDDFVLVFSRGC
jgi:predicted outer membrane repeat protein